MSVTYGFYNSINHDRKYDSEQLSRIFDGIITDGVYHSVGEAFCVTAGTGMTLNVASGRAWFRHTWTYNDSTIVVPVTEAHQVYDRIDALILRINKSTRTNVICVKDGTPGSSPLKPTMEDSTLIAEIPFAYVTVPAATVAVESKNVEFVVGTSECPFVTGVQNGVDIDVLVKNWKDQYDILVENWKDQFDALFNTLEMQITQAVSGTLIDWSVSYEKLAPDAVRRRFSNVTVSPDLFLEDDTYSDYGYRAQIPLVGVDDSFFPEVAFDVDVLNENNFAPVAKTYGAKGTAEGGLYIYATDVPNAEITISSITCWR